MFVHGSTVPSRCAAGRSATLPNDLEIGELFRHSLQSSYAMAENVFAVTQSAPGKSLPTVARSQVKGPSLSYQPDAFELIDDEYVSSGRCLKGMRLRIIGTDGSTCPDFVAGEIQLQTSCLFEGYWDRDGFRRDLFTEDGWYRTGDFGFVANEEVFVIGRMKDIIIVAGQNIFPEDVEIITSQVAGVYPGRVIAFGLDNEDLGTQGIGVVAEMSGEFDSAKARPHGERNPEPDHRIAQCRAARRQCGSTALDRQEHSRQNIAPRYSQSFFGRATGVRHNGGAKFYPILKRSERQRARQLRRSPGGQFATINASFPLASWTLSRCSNSFSCWRRNCRSVSRRNRFSRRILTALIPFSKLLKELRRNVKNPKLQIMLVLALTFVALGGLLKWDPFQHLRAIFAQTSPAQEDALVSSLFTDPNTQEVSNGEHPLANLRKLESSWCSVSNGTRYILTGNSQTFSVLLAPSEARPTQAERSYPDLLLDRLNAAGASVHGYRLSAPNISYMEVLWYLNYLIARPCLLPSEFIVQLNFETFRKTGVREGMLELLEDPNFASSIEQEARSNAPYASTFQQAIDQYNSRMVKQKGNEIGGVASSSKTGLSEALGAGSVLETNVRIVLDRLSLFKTRGQMKGELLDFLYLARVNLLGITPTTKRSLGGGTLTMNVSSLERIGELCKRRHIRLVFFNAPQNPNSPLYRTAADREQYQQIISRLAHEFAEGYYDFENSIPGPMWGVWIDWPRSDSFWTRCAPQARGLDV